MEINLNPETPTEQLIDNAQRVTRFADSKGRAIAIKDPGVLAQFELIKMVGAEAAKNEVYMNMILPMIFVCEIDGDPVPMPSSKLTLDALIQRLGHHGVTAVAEHVTAAFGANDPEADKAAIKK